MEMTLFLLIGVVTGWIAAELFGNRTGYGFVAEILIACIAAAAGGIVAERFRFNVNGLAGSVNFAVLSAVAALILTSMHRPFGRPR